MMIRLIFLSFLLCTFSCGKVGPLSLPEDQVDKSVITYPCDEACFCLLYTSPSPRDTG